MSVRDSILEYLAKHPGRSAGRIAIELHERADSVSSLLVAEYRRGTVSRIDLGIAYLYFLNRNEKCECTGPRDYVYGIWSQCRECKRWHHHMEDKP